MPRPLGEWFKECDDWGLCGKDLSTNTTAKGWHGGRLASALNTERLEKAQTQRCFSDVQLRNQGWVRETRMQTVHRFILGDKWLQDKIIQTDKILKWQIHHNFGSLKQSWCDACKLQLKQYKRMASNKRRTNYGTTNNNKQTQAGTDNNPSQNSSAKVDVGKDKLRAKTRYEKQEQKWTLIKYLVFL